jgi:hypothetical protein
LIDATGIEVLRELLARQRKGSGELLLAAVQDRVEATLRKVRFLQEIGESKIFWTADRAILSLGHRLPEPPALVTPEEDFTETLVLTPHADRVTEEG